MMGTVPSLRSYQRLINVLLIGYMSIPWARKNANRAAMTRISGTMRPSLAS